MTTVKTFQCWLMDRNGLTYLRLGGVVNPWYIARAWGWEYVGDEDSVTLEAEFQMAQGKEDD